MEGASTVEWYRPGMAPRFPACGAVLILACIAVTACAPATYAPSSQNASARVAAPVPLTKTTSASYEYVTDSQSTHVFKCRFGICKTCKAVGSGVEGIGTGPSNPNDATLAGSVLVVEEAAQQILDLDSSCNTMRTLSDSGYYPLDVAIARKGEVAVTNELSTNLGPGNITFYAPGSNQHNRVATGLLTHFYFGAFDADGNFYNDGMTSSGGSAIGVVRPGSSVDISAGISGVVRPGGIAVASNGTVNIVDQSCPCIQIYRGKSHVGEVTLSGAVDPLSLALNQSNDRVWVSDNAAGTVSAYPYPGGGKPVAVLKGFTDAYGVGVLPAPEP
jgi:hypothetical protein